MNNATALETCAASAAGLNKETEAHIAARVQTVFGYRSTGAARKIPLADDPRIRQRARAWFDFVRSIALSQGRIDQLR